MWQNILQVTCSKSFPHSESQQQDELWPFPDKMGSQDILDVLESQNQYGLTAIQYTMLFNSLRHQRHSSRKCACPTLTQHPSTQAYLS